MVKEIGTAFRKAQERGLSMAEFTRRVKEESGNTRGSSESSLRNTLEGDVEEPRSKILSAMARVLGLSEEFVQHGTGDSTPEESAIRAAAQSEPLWIDRKRGWEEQAVSRIREVASVPNSSATVVRSAFFDLLMEITTSPAYGGDDTVEDTVDFAAFLDDMLLQPVRWLFPEEVLSLEDEPTRGYLTGVMHSLALLIPKNDSAGLFGLPWKPALESKYMLRVLFQNDDPWETPVPSESHSTRVPLGELNKDDAISLAGKCYDLYGELRKAQMNLEKAAIGLGPQETLRDSWFHPGDAKLISEVATALGSKADQDRNVGIENAERNRVMSHIYSIFGSRENLIEELRRYEEERRASEHGGGQDG